MALRLLDRITMESRLISLEEAVQIVDVPTLDAVYQGTPWWESLLTIYDDAYRFPPLSWLLES